MNLPHSSLQLHRSHLLRLRGSHGRVIKCKSGRAWITLQDDCRDVFVGPGEAFVIEGQGLVLVEAIEPTVLTIQRGASTTSAVARLRMIWGYLSTPDVS